MQNLFLPPMAEKPADLSEHHMAQEVLFWGWGIFPKIRSCTAIGPKGQPEPGPGMTSI